MMTEKTSSVQAAKADLAPTGILRVGLNHSNFLIVNAGSSAGQPTGVAPDLAREIATALGVQIEFVAYASPHEMADAVIRNEWDIAFLGTDPARESHISFTNAYLEIESSYLVPPNSPIQSMAEVDREGVRVSAFKNSAYELVLKRDLKQAKLIQSDSIEESFQKFVDQKLEVLSGLRPRLVADAERIPGSRILDGKFASVLQAVGTRKECVAGVDFLRQFVEQAKRDGLVASFIDRHVVRGVTVAAFTA
ncbi:MAG: transporter substrate-binding domain-containing protein [Pseudomonadota bacterium]